MEKNFISLNNILSIKKKRELREQVYIKELIKSIKSRIELKKQNGEHELYFEVQDFIPGLPLINSIEICKMLKKELKFLKIKSKLVHENKLYIYWNKKETLYLHISPILEKIKNKITNSAYENLDRCVFEIPIFIPGKPLYNRKDTAKIIKGMLIEQGFICKIFLEFMLYISWSVEELEESGTSVKFKDRKYRKKERTHEKNKMLESQFEVYKNPDNTKTENELENEENSGTDSDGTLYENEYEKYFHMGNENENENTEQNNHFRYFSTFPKIKENRMKHTKGYKNNTRVYFPVEYTDPDELKSKVSFGENKVKRVSRKYNTKFKFYANPEKVKNKSMKVKYDTNYKPSNSRVDENTIKSLEQLNLEVKKLKN